MRITTSRRFPAAFLSCLAVFLLLSLSLSLLAVGGMGRVEAAPRSGWEVIDLPAEGVRHISSVDANTAYVSGAHTLMKTVDGSANWSMVFNDENTYIYDIDAVDAGNIWAVVLVSVLDAQGILVGKTLQVVKSADGGNSWTPVYAVDAPHIWDYMHMSISAVSPTVAWVALENGKILRTVDSGTNWTYSDAGLFPAGPAYDSYACLVSAVDANVAWVAGGKMGWTRSNPGGDPETLPGPPYAFFLPCHPMIVETTDGGVTWAVKQQGTYDEECTDVAASDALNAMVVGKDITYAPNPQMIMVNYTLLGRWPYFYWAVSGTSAVQSTHDGGFIWTPQLVNYPHAITSVDMADSSTAWVAGYDEAIFKTIDGGISGYPQASGITPGVGAVIYEIDAVDAATVWAVGYTPSGSVALRTANGGDPLPDIVSLSPGSGSAGNEITLSGCDFGAHRGSSYVSFGTIAATECVSWSDRQIVVKVPAGVTGEVKVTVTTAQGTSNGKPFTSTAPPPMSCGAGSGAATLMLGISLGLLSLAGMARVRGRRGLWP